jgi:hypothetical protein
MCVVSESSWPALFCHPLFRKAWEDSIARRPWTEEQGDSIVYIFGRMMAAESGMPLPRYSSVMTHEMIDIIKACDAFARQAIVAQWLQAHGDPSLMGAEMGLKQGDANS